MHQKVNQRILAFVLAVCTFLGLGLSAQAASIADGSKTCTVKYLPKHYYLTTTAGTAVRAGGYTYTTNDNITGPAYCIDHGLDWTGKALPITGKYSASPATAGAFANGYPQMPMSSFLERNLARHPALSGLTEDEYCYATQIAVWATLGQLAVDGTAFSNGRERLPYPTGDTQQMRVFEAVRVICNVAESWDRVYQTGMYIRVSEDQFDGNMAIPQDMTLDFAADEHRYGIRREVINGVSYYTKEYIFASATSTYWQDYTIDLWATGCPAGTIFTNLDNEELSRSKWHETDTWRTPVENRQTGVNYNGFEYGSKVKLCIPVDTATPSGEIILHAAAQVMQYEIYLANNEDNSEQSYILADPSKGTVEADAVLSWGGPATETGTLEVRKVGGSGLPLAGAVFSLDGSDGSHRTGTSSEAGVIRWELLDPNITYTLIEETPPAGFGIVEPITNIKVTAAQTTYRTVRDDPQHTLAVRKLDRQNGYSLQGVTMCFEQIDGDFKTTKVTDHAGLIQLNAEQLPVGSYKIYEAATRPGYELDPTPQTVHWDGKRDVTLTFENVRKPTLIISKQSSRTHYNLPGAAFEVYRDGSLVDTVTVNDAGLAYIHEISEGYWEIKEVIAPEGHILDSECHGIYIDPYDPATADDPRIVVVDDPLPSLRILKYDRASHKGMPSVTFEIFKDTVSLGKFQTDQSGEILLSHVEPGTYRVVEQDTGSDSHILDTTPQEVELRAGDDVRELVFFNDKLPGVHLTKVDASDLSTPIPNARFRFEKVGGGYGPVEYTTLADGTIDLSKLPVGSYVVTELECPGYVVDDAQRIIYLDGNDQAEFVFTNSKVPVIEIIKESSITHDPLPNVRFQVWYAASSGEFRDLGTFTTGEDGRITLSGPDNGFRDGWFRVKELAPSPGYALADPDTQEAFVPAGTEHTFRFTNTPLSALVVWKYDTVTGAAVPNCRFRLRYLGGEVSGSEGTIVGTYTTSLNGSFTVTGLKAGYYICEEIASDGNHIIDTAPQSVYISGKEQDVAKLYFGNAPKGSLLVTKVSTDEKNTPLADVEFLVTESDGTLVGNANGKFKTDSTGSFLVEGITPGTTLVVKEVRAKSGYLLDDTPQTATVQAGRTVKLEFRNQPLGGVEIVKVNEDARTERIPGVSFEIRKIDGGLVDTITTGKNGRAYLPLGDGSYYAMEVDCPSSYKLDSTPIYFTIKDGGTVTKTVTNKAFSGILLHKIDSTTRAGIPNVTFLLYDEKMNPIDQFTTDQRGYAYVDTLDLSGKVYLRELENDGYVPDDQLKTIYVKPGETTEVTWENTPITGQIQIVKTSADYNSINGWPAGTPLEGAVFEIYNERTGNKVDTIASGANGLAVSKPLPLARYVIREVRSPLNYTVNTAPIAAVLEYSGQIVRFEVTNKSVNVGVAITKTGPKEAVSGQPVRYVFSGISNTGNVTLDSYYWRDSLPSAVTLDKVVTGTYNRPGTYKVVYKVNDTGDYCTLADNLSTAKNYTLTATPAALGLAADERITEVMFVFGQVPGGFAQVEAPMIYCIAMKGLAPGSSFTNTADVGGIVEPSYVSLTPSQATGFVHSAGSPLPNQTGQSGLGPQAGAWAQAVTRWTTTVYGKPTPLPRTGY